MKTEQEHIVVVVDPLQSNSVAFDRALITAKLRNQPPVLHVIVGTDLDKGSRTVDAESTLVDFSLINNLQQQLVQSEVEFNLELSWRTSLCDVIIDKAERICADMVIVPDDSDVDGKLSDSHWKLLRSVSCPVLIAKPDAEIHRKVVLAAVKMQSGTDKYQQMNKSIIDRGSWMAERYGAELHLVNAYSNSMDYPDKGAMVRETGVDSERIHIQSGDPEAVISEVANKVDADIVVLGTMQRTGIKGALRGNTSERVMSRISQDLMVLTV